MVCTVVPVQSLGPLTWPAKGGLANDYPIIIDLYIYVYISSFCFRKPIRAHEPWFVPVHVLPTVHSGRFQAGRSPFPVQPLAGLSLISGSYFVYRALSI